ncbi:WG repeat-containing protein [Acinetobacter gyllenbergii]|uniref:WG repeat-containing protein n=1 Tax=Acinetobacter gyllenbergii TaxID=134534 RepID=UPI0003BF2339|nr:WG repeat-containing protein [Acinetobacter gyllenbergii]ESK43183.1 hypothetical protein F987_02064 [Acinetobacter gyllenbergii NIPH 230]
MLNLKFLFLSFLLSSLGVNCYAEEAENNFLLCLSKDQCGLLNLKGEWVVNPEYSNVRYVDKDKVVVEKNNLNAVLLNKNFIVPFKYNYISNPNKNGFMVFRIKDKFGVLDGSGAVKIEGKYDSLKVNDNNLVLFELNGKFGLMDINGVEIKKYSYKFNYLDDNYVRIELDGKFGFIDPEGKEVVPPKFTSMSNFFLSPNKVDYLSIVQENFKYGVIDSKGIFVIPPVYDKLDFYGSGFNKIGVKKDEKRGLIDIDNNVKFLKDFDYIDFSYNSDIGVARKDGLKMFIDLNGNLINSVYFQDAIPFYQDNPHTLVKINDELKAVNRKGGIIDLNNIHDYTEFSLIGSGANGIIFLKQNNKYGFLSNKDLTWLVEPRYKYIEERVLDLDKKNVVYIAYLNHEDDFEVFDRHLNKIFSRVSNECNNISIENSKSKAEYRSRGINCNINKEN